MICCTVVRWHLRVHIFQVQRLTAISFLISLPYLLQYKATHFESLKSSAKYLYFIGLCLILCTNIRHPPIFLDSELGKCRLLFKYGTSILLFPANSWQHIKESSWGEWAMYTIDMSSAQTKYTVRLLSFRTDCAERILCVPSGGHPQKHVGASLDTLCA
jgi:hypothetical protein